MALIGPAVGPELLTLNQEVYNKGISLSQKHMKLEKKIYYIFTICPKLSHSRAWTPGQGAINFTILVGGFMEIITMYSDFSSHVW